MCCPHHRVSAPCCLMLCLWKAACLPRGSVLLYSHIPKEFPLAAFPRGEAHKAQWEKIHAEETGISSALIVAQEQLSTIDIITWGQDVDWCHLGSAALWPLRCQSSSRWSELACFCSQMHLQPPQLLTSASVFPFC